MSILLIGPAEQKKIKDAIGRATARPVRWETVKDVATGDYTPTLKLDERKRKPGVVRPASEHLILGNVRVAYSHEEQPAGMFRHLSASVRRPGKLPHPMACAMICEAFGFSPAICAVIMQAPVTEAFVGRIWLEEFDPGHYAVNIIELIVTSEGGHA
jgi:hypothetical protein